MPPILMQNRNELQENQEARYVSDDLAQKIDALEGCLVDTKEVCWCWDISYTSNTSRYCHCVS